MIFYSVLILTFIAAVVSFVIPKKYKSVAQILPPTDEPDLLGYSSMLSTGLSSSNLSRLARVGNLFKSATPSDLIAAIVESRTIGEQVIIECDIMKEYRIKKSLEKALKLLKGLTKIKVTEEGVVQITVLAKKPALAANIVNTYIRLTDKFLKESNMSRGRNMRVFVEKRLATAESDLKQASDSLKIFQERNKIISLDDETKAVIDAYALLKTELLKREIELGVNENISTQDNPYVLTIKREIDEFKRQLNEIEKGKKTDKGFGVGFAVSFENLPAVAQEYARRLSNYKVQFEIYGLLVQQYEQARITEARDTPTITILDYGKIPEKKVFPKRIVIILIVFIASTITGILAAIVNEYFENLKQTQPEQHENWQNIFKQIKEIRISGFFHKLKPRKKS